MNIAILGAGNVGRSLHSLLTAGGLRAHICSRSPNPEELTFAEGVALADVVILAVPYVALADLLPSLASQLQGKVVIDCTNPLNPDWSPLILGQENSAGEEVARLLPMSRVVKAFNTVFADVMTTDRVRRGGLRATAFVAGDDAAAKRTVTELAILGGLDPLDVGPLRMSRYLEAMAHLNIQIAVGQGGGTNAAFVYHQVK